MDKVESACFFDFLVNRNGCGRLLSTLQWRNTEASLFAFSAKLGSGFVLDIEEGSDADRLPTADFGKAASGCFLLFTPYAIGLTSVDYL